MLKKLIGIGMAGAACAVAALTGLGGAAARATTGNNTGLPDPAVELSRHIGDAYEGRFLLRRVPRDANIYGAVMDITLITEDDPPFYFGKIFVKNFTKSGSTEIEELAVWWFDYHRQDNRLTARLIPPATVTPTKPAGEQIGQLTFEVPGGRTGLANKGRELEQLKNVHIELKGRGTIPATFERQGTPGESLIAIPRAERYGS